MIGRIKGRVLELRPSEVVVDTGGVGYEVDIAISTYNRIQGEAEVSLYTHLAVREDAHQLFGFYTAAERDLFRELIRVKGVGPRLGLTILSGMDADGLIQCIHTKDTKALTALPGVGKKTADQLVLDLEGRLPEVVGKTGAPIATMRGGGNLDDAEQALIGLGFKPQEAARALAHVEDPDADVETLIKRALKGLA